MRKHTLQIFEYLVHNGSNTQLIFVPTPTEGQKFTSCSVCIEAIRDPRLDIYDYCIPSMYLQFNVSLDHAASAAHPATVKTVNELFDSAGRVASIYSGDYRKCQVYLLATVLMVDDLYLFKGGQGENVSQGDQFDSCRRTCLPFETMQIHWI